MDIKDYLRKQMEAGVDTDDILDNVYSICNEINEENEMQNQKGIDARAIIESELEFIAKYYPNVYEKYYKDTPIKELVDDLIESFELYDENCEKGFSILFDELFDALK